MVYLVCACEKGLERVKKIQKNEKNDWLYTENLIKYKTCFWKKKQSAVRYKTKEKQKV